MKIAVISISVNITGAGYADIVHMHDLRNATLQLEVSEDKRRYFFPPPKFTAPWTLSMVWTQVVMDREAWLAAVHRVAKSRTWLSDSQSHPIYSPHLPPKSSQKRSRNVWTVIGPLSLMHLHWRDGQCSFLTVGERHKNCLIISLYLQSNVRCMYIKHAHQMIEISCNN